MDEQKKLMRDLLFSSTNMAAMTLRENLLCRGRPEKKNYGKDVDICTGYLVAVLLYRVVVHGRWDEFRSYVVICQKSISLKGHHHTNFTVIRSKLGKKTKLVLYLTLTTFLATH